MILVSQRLSHSIVFSLVRAESPVPSIDVPSRDRSVSDSYLFSTARSTSLIVLEWFILISDTVPVRGLVTTVPPRDSTVSFSCSFDITRLVLHERRKRAVVSMNMGLIAVKSGSRRLSCLLFQSGRMLQNKCNEVLILEPSRPHVVPLVFHDL